MPALGLAPLRGLEGVENEEGGVQVSLRRVMRKLHVWGACPACLCSPGTGVWQGAGSEIGLG